MEDKVVLIPDEDMLDWLNGWEELAAEDKILKARHTYSGVEFTIGQEDKE